MFFMGQGQGPMHAGPGHAGAQGAGTERGQRKFPFRGIYVFYTLRATMPAHAPSFLFWYCHGRAAMWRKGVSVRLTGSGISAVRELSE